MSDFFLINLLLILSKYSMKNVHYCLQLGKKNTRKLFWAIVTGRVGNINTGKPRFTVVTARQRQNKKKNPNSFQNYYYLVYLQYQIEVRDTRNC